MAAQQAHTTRATRIVMIGTGGTISSRHTDDGVVAQASTRELLDSLTPDALPDGLEVTTRDEGTRTSFAFTLDDMLAIARAALDAARDADGVVVLHGTDSMEETSFLLDLLHDAATPIVVTGAQRPFDAPDGDGPANMTLALRTAADPRARGRGVLVAFDGAIWPARGVRKVHTSDLAAFATPGGAPLDLEGPSAAPRSTFALAADAGREITGMPRVDVVAGVPGGDGTGVRAALAAGARGIVFQGLGIGNAGPGDGEALLAAAADGVPVLITTRVGAGSVHPVYGNGGGDTLAKGGAIFAGALSPWQARVLTSLALALEPADLPDLLREWIAGHGAGLDVRA